MKVLEDRGGGAVEFLDSGSSGTFIGCSWNGNTAPANKVRNIYIRKFVNFIFPIVTVKTYVKSSHHHPLNTSIVHTIPKYNYECFYTFSKKKQLRFFTVQLLTLYKLFCIVSWWLSFSSLSRVRLMSQPL